MPSTSKKLARFMAAACNNKDFADKVGIDQKVACDFFDADQKKKKLSESFLEFFVNNYLKESFVSDLLDMKKDDLTKVLKSHDSSIPKVEHSKFLKLHNGTDAEYIFATHDKDNNEYIVNRALVSHYLGKGKRVNHVTSNPEHIGSLKSTIDYINQKGA